MLPIDSSVRLLVAALAGVLWLTAPASAQGSSEWFGLRFDGAYVELAADGKPDCASAWKGPLTFGFSNRAAFGGEERAELHSDALLRFSDQGRAPVQFGLRTAGTNFSARTGIRLYSFQFGLYQCGGLDCLTRGTGSALLRLTEDRLGLRSFYWSGDSFETIKVEFAEGQDGRIDRPLGFCEGVAAE